MEHHELLRIVIVGHVDHGKSTLIGRLVHDTGSMPPQRVEAVREACARQGREFELAYLMDALEEEQRQNVTIDTAQTFFRTNKRTCVIIDAPGHKDFLKNMITGAASADAAILIVDAEDGVREQTRRHAWVLNLLGVKQVAVVVNKLDRRGYSRERFEALQSEAAALLHAVEITPAFVIPVSAREGDNVARGSERTPWYTGPTVLEALDSFLPASAELHLPFRFPVQDVYRWDGMRAYAGRVETGKVHVGDRVIFAPSGRQSRVRGLQQWGRSSLLHAQASQCVAVFLEDDLFIERGEVMALHDCAPSAGTEIEASVFWLGASPLEAGRSYTLKVATAQAKARIVAIENRMDTSTLNILERHAAQMHAPEVANVTLGLDKAVAADVCSLTPQLGRMVLLDGPIVAGGGLIRRVASGSGEPELRRIHLDERVCDEPDGAFVDLIHERGPVEITASGDFLRRLARGGRAAFRLLGPDLALPLARLACEHRLSLRLHSQGEAAWVVLAGQGPPTPPERDPHPAI